MPQDVNDQNSVTWGDNSMNILQLAGVTAAASFIKNPKKSFEEVRQIITELSLIHI